MKIYIVTQGAYSDYHIVGCFDNEQTAREFCKWMNNRKLSYYSDDFEIESFELNSTFSKQLYWFVRMDKKGKVIEIEEHGYRGLQETTVDFDSEKNLIMFMGADDETTAVKITNEHRAMLIATNQWAIKKQGDGV